MPHIRCQRGRGIAYMKVFKLCLKDILKGEFGQNIGVMPDGHVKFKGLNVYIRMSLTYMDALLVHLEAVFD